MNEKLSSTIVWCVRAALLATLTACAAAPQSQPKVAPPSAAQVAAETEAAKLVRVERLREVGDMAYRLGDWAAAEQSYRALLAESNEEAAVWLRLGTVFLRTQRPDLAVVAYDAATRLGATDLTLFQNKALAHASLASAAALRAQQLTVDAAQRRELGRFIGSVDAALPRDLRSNAPRAPIAPPPPASAGR